MTIAADYDFVQERLPSAEREALERIRVAHQKYLDAAERLTALANNHAAEAKAFEAWPSRCGNEFAAEARVVADKIRRALGDAYMGGVLLTIASDYHLVLAALDDDTHAMGCPPGCEERHYEAERAALVRLRKAAESKTAPRTGGRFERGTYDPRVMQADLARRTLPPAAPRGPQCGGPS